MSFLRKIADLFNLELLIMHCDSLGTKYTRKLQSEENKTKQKAQNVR